MRKAIAFPIIALVAVASCSDDPLGLLHGIVAGNHQTIVAGTAELPDGVTWRLVRSKNGTITGHWTDPFLPKYAHAQGAVTVTGSPVPGAVVCVEEVPELVPFVRCTNTDANGEATFFIDVATNKMGTYRAQIRGTLNSQPAVFDTISATVEAGAANPMISQNWLSFNPSPATLSHEAAADNYGNPIPFRLVGDGWLQPQGDTVGTAAARRLVFPASAIDSAPGSLEMRGAAGQLYGRVYYSFIIQNGDVTSIQMRVRGVNLPAP